MTLKMNFFLAFLCIFFILLVGCISSQTPPNPPVTSPNIPPTTQINPVQTTVPTTFPGTPTSVTTITKEQVSELFIDIAFGCDNTRIDKFNPSSNIHLFYSLEGQVNNDDIEFVTQFAKNYNILMSVDAFSDDPLSSRGNQIIIFPQDSLNSLEKSYIVCQELDPKSGEPLYIIYKPIIENPNGQKEVLTKIYLNSELQGAQRNHYLEKAMLYYLGFPGQTYTYPDSVFFYNTQSNVDFIPIDIEAMKTMYYPGIYSGMTVQDVRRLLLNN